MAVDGPFGAYADDSERRRPEKGQEADRQDNSRTADTQPAEVRSRAEYYEVLRSQDQEVTGSVRAETAPSTTRTRSSWSIEAVEDHPDRPLPDSLRTTPERTKHILDGDSWGGGHRHGTGRPGKTEFRPDGTTTRLSGTSEMSPVRPMNCPFSSPTIDGGCMASATTSVLPSSSFPMGGSGQRGRTPTARVWSRTRRRNRERS